MAEIVTGYEKVKTFQQSAERAFLEEDYELVANRAYYAMFMAVRLLLTEHEHIIFEKTKTHSSVISKFSEHYIKTQKTDVIYGKILGRNFDIRGVADYSESYFLSKTEAIQIIEEMRMFLTKINELRNLPS